MPSHCGLKNVAPTDNDLSHPKYYRSQKRRGKAGKSNSGGDEPIEKEDVGQPGCTDRERERFESILKEGGLVDAYRGIHGDAHRSEEMTWRGAPTGMHGGRGMRIDHCVVSEDLLTSIDNVTVLGRAERRVGFIGSDHCPLLICYQPPASPIDCCTPAHPTDSKDVTDVTDAKDVEDPSDRKGVSKPDAEGNLVVASTDSADFCTAKDVVNGSVQREENG